MLPLLCALVVPPMAARDDLGRPVVGREVVDGPEGADPIGRPWPRHGIEAVVEVQGLLGFARVGVDRQAGREHEVRPQHGFADVQHTRVGRQLGEHRTLGEQGIDPFAAGALEIVAPVPLPLQPGRQRGPDRLHGGRREQARQDHVALLVQVLQQDWRRRRGVAVLQHRYRPLPWSALT